MLDKTGLGEAHLVCSYFTLHKPMCQKQQNDPPESGNRGVQVVEQRFKHIWTVAMRILLVAIIMKCNFHIVPFLIVTIIERTNILISEPSWILKLGLA